jgi:ubiquinol-cytochrome c reductase cytochrome c1 subunit
MWTSDPHLEDRHRIGARVMIFLVVFACVMYAVKRRVWSKIPH